MITPELNIGNMATWEHEKLLTMIMRRGWGSILRLEGHISTLFNIKG